MKCSEVRPLLDLLYDELLETKDSALVLDHIKNCNQCRSEWEAMEELRTRIAAARSNTFVPSELMEKVSLSLKNEDQSKRIFGLLPQQIPLVSIAASILLVAWFLVPQFLRPSHLPESLSATPTSTAQKLIADLTADGAVTPEPDKQKLDKRVGYDLKYVHLPSWKLQQSGIYLAQANIARFDFVRDGNSDQRLSCYQAPEGTIKAVGNAQELAGKQVTFGNQSGYQFAKWTQNGRDYLFVTKLPQPVLEEIIRGA
ncbi:MAG: hypothetical protein JST89_08615 [Cyanobacteria bacterium SZAS-4]|nr:hypothetical protein [Cyanobacteria bacterium SZAS-4]